MKKTDLSLILLFLLFPLVSSATSGACSDHKGVNCSLSNAFNSVICIDGSFSNTNYSDLKECKNVRCDVNSINGYCANSGMIGSPSCSSAVDNCNNFNKNLDNQTSSISTYFPTISNEAIARELAKREMDNLCASEYGQSFFNLPTKTCECNADFIMYKNLCVNEAELRYYEEKITEINRKQNEAFNAHYDKVLEAMPQYKGISDREVIRKMSFDPTNAKKTFAEIFAEAYPDVKPIEEKIKIEPVKIEPEKSIIVNNVPIVEKNQEKVVKLDKTEEVKVLPDNNIKPDIQQVKQQPTGIFGKIKHFFTNIFKFKWF